MLNLAKQRKHYGFDPEMHLKIVILCSRSVHALQTNIV